MNEIQEEKSATTPWIVTGSFSPDGTCLITGSLDGYLTEWDTATGRKARVLLDPSAVEDFNPTVTWAGEGKEDEEELGFQLERLSENMRGSSIVSVCFSPDGEMFAVGAANGAVVIWGAHYRGEWYAWQASKRGVVALDISPDGQWIATGIWEDGGEALRVWRMPKAGKEMQAKEAFSDHLHMCGVWAVSFSSDNRFLAAGGSRLSGYTGPGIYSLETGKRITTLLYDITHSLQFSPDGQLLATGDAFGTVSIWDVKESKRVFEMKKAHSEMVATVLFSPDGRRLVSGSWDGGLRIWDIGTGRQLEEHFFNGQILTCRFSPDGRFLSVAEAAKGADHPGIHRLSLHD